MLSILPSRAGTLVVALILMLANMLSMVCTYTPFNIAKREKTRAHMSTSKIEGGFEQRERINNDHCTPAA